MPTNAVDVACAYLNGSQPHDHRARGNNSISADMLERLNAAMNVFVNDTGNLACHNISMEMVGATTNSVRASAAFRFHRRHASKPTTAIDRRRLRRTQQRTTSQHEHHKHQRQHQHQHQHQHQRGDGEEEEEAAAAAAAAAAVGMPLDSIYETWNYQVCTELILEPLTSDGNGFYVESDEQVGWLVGCSTCTHVRTRCCFGGGGGGDVGRRYRFWLVPW